MIKKRLRKIVRNFIYAFPSSGVLMFHHVEDTPALPRSKCLLATERFYEIISAFPEDAYVSVRDVQKIKRKIAITFDDGIEDVYRIAYPYLKKHNIPFCIFIVTDFLDQPGYITTEQLLEMNKDPLVTIGSHGITHEVLKGLPEETQIRELSESKRILEEKLGKNVDCFAYSHGQYDEVTLKHVRIYPYAFSVIAKPLNILTNKKWELPRINIDSAVNLDSKKREISRILKLDKREK